MSDNPQRDKDEGKRLKAEGSTNSPPSPKPSAPPSFWAELKRRKVTRVAIAYAVVSWIVMQVGSIVFPNLGAPAWILSVLIVLVILGFPVAIVLAWAFEMTPDGIKTTKATCDESGSAPASAQEQKRRNLKAVVFAAALPTLIFGALAVFFFFRSDSSSASPGLVESDKSIAVLPLENMSPDPENAFFAKGVHEDILTHLSRIAELKVTSRTSTLQFADAKRNLSDIGAALGVRYVVEGSVRRAANQVRVTVQLIDAKTDEHLWAENYDRELKDIFTIQSEIAKQIAAAVHATISPQESGRIEEMPTENLLAYDYYVKGRERLYSTVTIPRSRAFFEKALEYDPNFALAHLGMGKYYVAMVLNDHLPSKEGFSKAEEWLRSAEALGHDNQDTYSVLRGTINTMYKWDWASGLKDFEEAIAAERNSTTLKALAWHYVAVGNFGKAVEANEAAVELDPLNLKMKQSLAAIYNHAGNYEESMKVCLSILDADSNMGNTIRILSDNHRRLGRFDEAIKLAEKAELMQEGKGGSRATLGLAYIAAGRRADALKLIESMLKDERAFYVPKISLAELYFEMGEINEGFEWLEQAYEIRDSYLPLWLNNPRDQNEALRADPRFQNIVDRMNFPE